MYCCSCYDVCWCVVWHFACQYMFMQRVGRQERREKEIGIVSTLIFFCCVKVHEELTFTPSSENRPKFGPDTHAPHSPAQLSNKVHISPSLPSPHLTSPHLTSPHLTSPHLTSPHLTISSLTSLHTSKPTYSSSNHSHK